MVPGGVLLPRTPFPRCSGSQMWALLCFSLASLPFAWVLAFFLIAHCFCVVINILIADSIESWFILIFLPGLWFSPTLLGSAKNPASVWKRCFDPLINHVKIRLLGDTHDSISWNNYLSSHFEKRIVWREDAGIIKSGTGRTVLRGWHLPRTRWPGFQFKFLSLQIHIQLLTEVID